MSDDNRHILQAAEEKLEKLTTEVFKLREELDRYSTALVKSEKECAAYRTTLVKITATGDNEAAKMAREALET